jgi:iron(II)-dependent oxidoreductase
VESDLAIAAPSAMPVPGQEPIALLQAVRARTLELISHLQPAALERSPDPIMSPLCWDLAHIAAYEDLWLCCRHGGLALLRADLADHYDAFATPREQRQDRQAGFLDSAGALSYMAAVRERSLAVVRASGPGDGKLLELVVRHELQHTETMRQTMALAGELPPGEPPTLRIAGPCDELDFNDLAGGEVEIGAGQAGFAYDNERPRHRRRIAPFAIARRPLCVGDWQRFSQAGGYRNRALWSDQGWRWLAGATHERHPQAPAADRDCCLVHISYHEAQAIAAFFGARLPSEAEWEHAAAAGALGDLNLVWEWVADQFDRYPGFRADPYREYSEVFFGRGYRVLRGASWATHERCRSVSFRNWDLPERRQIFAGTRLARDL